MSALIITLTNKDRNKLERLREWILRALEDWARDDERPMKGTEVDSHFEASDRRALKRLKGEQCRSTS